MSTHPLQRGLTLVEVLVAITLLAILLVPAISALRTSVVGAEVNSDVTQIHYRLTSRMEQTLAEPFESLEAAAIAAGDPTTATSYSDAPGEPGRLLVFLSPWDADNLDGDDNGFTGTDDGLIWIRVTSEGTVHALETITAQGF